MNSAIRDEIAPLLGKSVCRLKVGNQKSLSIGLGQKHVHGDSRLEDSYYGEWEIGTYYGDWRVIKNGRLVLGSGDSSHGPKDLDNRLNRLEFGRVSSIDNTNQFDVHVQFENDIGVDIIATNSDDDEYFHIFCPNDICIVFSSTGEWIMGKSSGPWTK